MLQAITVDDENRSREALHRIINEFCPDVEVVALAHSVESGLEAISHNPNFDLLFLDIEMNTETGFDLLSKIPQIQFDVIFTTAHESYALRAIKFCAIDYLLKPIDLTELRQAVAKVREKRSKDSFQKKFDAFLHNMHHSNRKENQQIAIPTNDGLIFLNVADIMRLQAEGPYTYFHMRNGNKILVSKNLKEYERLLADFDFFRVHNSYIINTKEIKKYVRGEGGYVIMTDNFTVDVSKRKKEAFLAQIAKV